LIFLNPEDVENYFSLDLYNTKPNDDHLDTFYDYLKNTYIGEQAIFPPKVWAETSSELTKSTNACESFHAHFKSSFNHSHPNIIIFIDTLKNIQSKIYIQLQSMHKPNSCHNNKLKIIKSADTKL